MAPLQTPSTCRLAPNSCPVNSGPRSCVVRPRSSPNEKLRGIPAQRTQNIRSALAADRAVLSSRGTKTLYPVPLHVVVIAHTGGDFCRSLTRSICMCSLNARLRGTLVPGALYRSVCLAQLSQDSTTLSTRSCRDMKSASYSTRRSGLTWPVRNSHRRFSGTCPAKCSFLIS